MGCGVAFDSEDYHLGEFVPSERDTLAYRLTANLESKYFPKCLYITTPSDGISDAIAGKYNVKRPVTIRNVFPLDDVAAIKSEPKDRQGKSLSLYWYSQIIGTNRGIQDAIKAASLLTEPVQLHIRGDGADEVKRELSEISGEAGSKVQMFFHDVVHPNELLSRTAEHDVGLALERTDSQNRQLTVANKFYFYALAGLAIAATNTDGQSSEIDRHPAVGFTYTPGDYRKLSQHLQAYIDDPLLLARTKQESFDCARNEWNWEKESLKLVESVSSVLKN